jgi:hypothetical protein
MPARDFLTYLVGLATITGCEMAKNLSFEVFRSAFLFRKRSNNILAISLFYNLSFGFCRYENRQGLEAKFVDLLEGNSQVAIFESKSTNFDREITCFRVKKLKAQVYKLIQTVRFSI